MQEPDTKQPCEDQDENTSAKALVDEIIEETENESITSIASESQSLHIPPQTHQ